MDDYKTPIGRLGEQAIEFTQSNLKPPFTAFEVSAELSVEGFHLLFLALPPWAWIVIVAAVVWRLNGIGSADVAGHGGHRGADRCRWPGRDDLELHHVSEVRPGIRRRFGVFALAIILDRAMRATMAKTSTASAQAAAEKA